jgi:hypothetical protein
MYRSSMETAMCSFARYMEGIDSSMEGSGLLSFC